ncbi:hypothetical protein [Sorangium sp. So ce1024]|uniref:hypothetical protein n=1 Tax=Sorangium sp. So ce1024 TaxID=3133327 RepID=UPI003EFEFA06
MSTDGFSVVIDYITADGGEHTVHLAPEEYFDLGESDVPLELSVDSPPKHQEVRQYLPEGTPLRQARVRVSNASAGDSWEVFESYWSQLGDEGISVTVREVRGGVVVDWKKFINIRLGGGHERVLVLVQGDEFPLLDGYVVIEQDKHQRAIQPERGGLYRRRQGS